MEITTINELFDRSIPIDTSEVVHDYFSDRSKRLDSRNWLNAPANAFNTRNGILVFTDESCALHVIPNFKGLISLLQKNGFSQNYILVVPFADDSFFPKSHLSSWRSLNREFLQCCSWISKKGLALVFASSFYNIEN